MSRIKKIHHRERIKNKKRFYLGRDLLSEHKTLGRLINTSSTCSCSTCGNQRRWQGDTMQERKSLDYMSLYV